MRDYAAEIPLAGVARDDRKVEAAVGVTFRSLQWMGFAPRLEYRYAHNDSAVDIFDYDSHSLGLYLTRRF
jgi:hypothetical protein